MSGDVAISVRGLSKAYTIAHNAERPITLAETMLQRLRHPFRRQPDETFHALKDVSFDVMKGDVVGIIGRNGAGKSTLLKILSRITEPSKGEIDLYGRVGSLLEVGTGFHPELTGRENVYLNGHILGMRKKEIDREFDAIVDFSGVERFLDTPVKRYSSGMYVRLAFSVAAHLNPEILIVDEVLAVGDVGFQRKCLGKMEDVSRTGRTVLFVSHSMPIITRLCPKAILLKDGRVAAHGDSTEITRLYFEVDGGSSAHREWHSPEDAPGDSCARLRSVRVTNVDGEITDSVDVSEEFRIAVEYWNQTDELRPTVSIQLVNDQGLTLFVSNDFSNQQWWNQPRRPGVVAATCTIPPHLLSEGQFSVVVALCTYDPDHVHAFERDAVSFQVKDSVDVDRIREKYTKQWPGLVRPRLSWQVKAG
jgi:lipopolysaccharide transport system ATP-binding protein